MLYGNSAIGGLVFLYLIVFLCHLKHTTHISYQVLYVGLEMEVGGTESAEGRSSSFLFILTAYYPLSLLDIAPTSGP
jgi:hypothetical protein